MVSIKHKVTIKRKQPEVTPESKDDNNNGLNLEQPQPQKQPEKKSNAGKIVGGIAAAALIISGIYYFSSKDGNDVVDEEMPTEQIVQDKETVLSETRTSDTSTVPTEEDVATSSSEAECATHVGVDEGNVTTEMDKVSNLKSADQKQVDQIRPHITSTESIKSKQNKVMIANTKSAPLGEDVVENAHRVIRGDFGNGQVRKDALGDKYQEIQNKVNEIYRKKGLTE